MAHDSPVIVSGLAKSFGDLVVFQGASLRIERGEVVGLFGPNGSGKTTLLRILAGLDADYDGEVRVCGADPKTKNVLIKQRAGFVPSDPALYEALSGRELLRFVGRLHAVADRRLNPRLEALFGLLDLEESADRPVRGYSHGMRNKVALATSLLHAPRLVLWDEPFAGLDVRTVQTLLGLIREASRKGVAVLLSSHRRDALESVCDRLLAPGERVLSVAPVSAADRERAVLSHELPSAADVSKVEQLLWSGGVSE